MKTEDKIQFMCKNAFVQYNSGTYVGDHSVFVMKYNLSPAQIELLEDICALIPLISKKQNHETNVGLYAFINKEMSLSVIENYDIDGDAFFHECLYRVVKSIPNKEAEEWSQRLLPCFV